MIVVNFKTYRQATGQKARKMAEICRRAQEETGTDVIVVPAAEDLIRTSHVDVEAFSQHIDPVEPGSHTGHTLPENVKEAGASGTLLNHSERRIPEDQIKDSVEMTRRKDLTTVVCAQDPEECEKFSSFDPDYIAYEPPELIGGDTSVSEAKPELIQEAVERSGDVPTLTGAGIRDAEDVRKSIELGCEGVLVASGVVKADDPHNALKQLCKGTKKEVVQK